MYERFNSVSERKWKIPAEAFTRVTQIAHCSCIQTGSIFCTDLSKPWCFPHFCSCFCVSYSSPCPGGSWSWVLSSPAAGGGVWLFRGQHAGPAGLTSIIQPLGLWKCLIVKLCPVVSWFGAGRWEIFRWPQEKEEIDAGSLVAQVNALPMKERGVDVCKGESIIAAFLGKLTPHWR